MDATAVVLEEPRQLRLAQVELLAPADDDVVVDIYWSGISTGTEKLLWAGQMPEFPGMGYPLVPGYESVGRIVAAGPASGRLEGETVFVPGARCFANVRGLFGGAASRLIVPGRRVHPIDESLGEQGVLLALAATAHHSLCRDDGDETPVDLVVGHGVLGRLVARIAVALGCPPPVVWECNPVRREGARGYQVIEEADDERRDYRRICDVSGADGLLDTLIGRLGRGGEIILAGFYREPVAFTFPPAFMREAKLRIAAEFRDEDVAAVTRLLGSGALSLDDLITHRYGVGEAQAAYRAAFEDPACLKMVLDWRGRPNDR
jgi:3-hydroxyethyl bacteriochlorophyllide a dehydrogenase